MSWFALVPWSTLAAVFVMLRGLGSAWVGIRMPHINRATAPSPDAPPIQRWSPTEAWLWRIAWILTGLGFSGLGLTGLHYAKGQYVEVPGNAPLIDRVIWISSFVCLAGGFAVLYALAMASTVRAKRARREDVGS